MRRLVWLTLGWLLTSALGPGNASAASKVELDTTKEPGYRALADLAVMDRGRVKPLDTLAAERVKLIHSRTTIKLKNENGETIQVWGPVAALLDWSVRPEFWDEQEFLLVEYLPLKRMLLADRVRHLVEEIAARESTPADTRSALESLADSEEFSEAELATIFALPGLNDEDKAQLKVIDHKLAADTKWLAPSDLENAHVDLDGQHMSFLGWFERIFEKQQQARARSGMSDAAVRLSTLEEKVDEVGQRLLYYIAIRDGNPRGAAALDVNILPRPSSTEYLDFTAGAMKAFESESGMEGLTPLQLDSIRILSKYYEGLQKQDRMPPGQFDPELLGAEATQADEAAVRELRARQETFNARFADWLGEKAEWVPMRIVLNTDPDELTRAGFPAEAISAFRESYQAMIDAEQATPGALPEDRAAAVLASARSLGSSIGDYPSAAAMARETHFNRFAPFYKAPMAYGLAFFLFLIALGIMADRTSTAGRVGKALYWVGMIGFVAGIALETYGFYLRVVISRWAPVTNMYETVIWVALVTAVIGLILELIYRRIYAALAASGVALLATILAANVSLLDPTIGSLQPVLRSNYWLTIHVLTIVSSYAAFALALGLGLLAVGFYLTAHYRGCPSFKDLAAPLVPGLPLAAVGIAGIYGSYKGWSPSLLGSEPGFYLTALLAAFGGVLSIMAIFGVVGELANRVPKAAVALGLLVLIPGVAGAAAHQLEVGPAWLIGTAGAYASWILAVVGFAWMMLGLFGGLANATFRDSERQLVGLDALSLAAETDQEELEHATTGSTALAAADGNGGVATLTRPSVAEIKARVAGNRPKLDAVGLSMQATAGRIKPLSNFIYRAMQVGVLLCAAGTILGGVWADYSWGRFWGWDPKEVWALITLLVYLIPLHGRFAGWVNTFGLVVASVVCFLSVLMAWYGVNFVLGVGLHSYGFVEGGGQGIVMAVSLAVLAVVAGAGWRRYLASRPTLA